MTPLFSGIRINVVAAGTEVGKDRSKVKAARKQRNKK